MEELNISKKAEKTKTAIGFVESGIEVFVDLFGTIDIEAEKVRLQKEIAGVEPYVYWTRLLSQHIKNSLY